MNKPPIKLRLPNAYIPYIKLEELYGAEFNCGIDKLGDDSVFNFYIESLNDIQPSYEHAEITYICQHLSQKKLFVMNYY